jgi:hypothetical protein
MSDNETVNAGTIGSSAIVRPKKTYYLVNTMVAAAIIGMDGFRPRKEKQPRKCILKDCQRMTTHNGGYCSAEHCKLDRERKRSNAPDQLPRP